MASTYVLSIRGQENFAGLDIPWRFAPGPSNRYHKDTNPSGLISFATAEIVGVQEELEEYVRTSVRIPGEAFLYSFSSAGGPRFHTAMASFINDNFKPNIPVTKDNIITAGGVTPIEDMLAFNLADPGEGILVAPPIYGRFELDFGNEARLKIIYAQLAEVDPFAEDIIEKYEQAFEEAESAGTKIRAVLISNPSNPLGECYPPQTLKSIIRFCQKKQIHLISDEVYAMSVFDSGNPDAPPFTSVLSFDTTDLIDPNLLHCLYGMSKDFGAAGLRLGCLITHSTPVLRACTSIIRFHNPSGPSIAIGTAILEDKAFHTAFLGRCRQRLASGYKITTASLTSAGVNYRKSGNAGLFVYVDLSPYLPPLGDKIKDGKEREFKLAQHFVDNGVFLHPGEEHSEKAGWFRLVFASLEEGELKEGLRRLLNALEFVPWK